MLLDDVKLQMTIGSWLQANLVYRAAVVLRGEGSVFSAAGELRTLQFLACDELLRRQDEKLLDILRYARQHSAYYNSRWAEILPPGSLSSSGREWLSHLPFVTKTDLQNHLDQLIAKPVIRPFTRKTTGGSTGQAVTVVKDRRAIGQEMAATWLGYGWYGVQIGDKQARFWGRPQSFRRRVRAFAARVAVRRLNFSAFAFSDEDLERYWRRCLRERPTFFYGYVSMIEAFAAFVQRQGLDGRMLGLKLVVTTSEVLGEPQRRTIAEAFGAPVQNEYGCGEVGAIAYECEKGLLHVMSDNLIVEVLDDEGRPVLPGQSGHVVVTDLNNRAMPLIRYRVGDLAVPGPPCPCGRGFPTLMRVWGREYDFVQDADGKRYHGEYIMYVFEDLRDQGVKVRQFQVIQRAPRSLEVLIVTDDPDGHRIVAAAVEELMRRIPRMVITGRQVDAIERAASGKMRLIRNEVMPPVQPVNVNETHDWSR